MADKEKFESGERRRRGRRKLVLNVLKQQDPAFVTVELYIIEDDVHTVFLHTVS